MKNFLLKIKRYFCNHKFKKEIIYCLNPYTKKEGRYYVSTCEKCNLSSGHNGARLNLQWQTELYNIENLKNQNLKAQKY